MSNPSSFTSPGPDILWLGAHKTGTTFLQKSLDLSRAALLANRIDCPDLATIRNHYTRPLLQGGAPPTDSSPPFSAYSGNRRLVFDENIAAVVQNAATRDGLYAEAGDRSGIVAHHLGMVRPVIVFGIRNLAGYLPSLYCEALKSTAFRRFSQFMPTRPDALRWSDVIWRLQQAFPVSPVLVYAYESLRGNEARLLSTITGMDAGAFTLLPDPERQGFSDQAVRVLHDLDRVRTVGREDIRTATRDHPRTAQAAAFSPWTPAERAHFDVLYAADRERIAAMRRVTLLSLAPERRDLTTW